MLFALFSIVPAFQEDVMHCLFSVSALTVWCVLIAESIEVVIQFIVACS